MSERLQCDVAVVGGGHNALVAAAALARTGLRVAAFEAAERPGGYAACGELSGEAAVDFGLLRAEVVEALELERHGLELAPLPALGGCLEGGVASGVLWSDSDRLLEGRPRSEHAAVLSGLRRLDALRAQLEELLAADPSPRLLGALIRSPDLVRALSGSAEELAVEILGEGAPATAACAVGCSWTAAEPHQQGTGLQLLLQLAGARPRVALGGVRPAVSARGLGEALQRSLGAAGGELHLEAPVRRIVVEAGRATGLLCERGGETLRVEARRVLSGVDAWTTLVDLVGAERLRVDEVRAVQALRRPATVVRAVFDLPEADPDAHRELLGLRLFAGADRRRIERAAAAVRRGRSAEEPWLEIVPLAGPRGLRCVVHAHGLGAGHGAADVERFVAFATDRVGVALGSESPVHELRQHRRCPSLWSQRLGGAGDGFHAAMVPEQMFALRPLAHWGGGRLQDGGSLAGRGGWPTSIDGLDFCGAAAHPGGYVTGLPGLLAARRCERLLGTLE